MKKKTISLLLTCSIACTMLAGCNEIDFPDISDIPDISDFPAISDITMPWDTETETSESTEELWELPSDFVDPDPKDMKDPVLVFGQTFVNKEYGLEHGTTLCMLHNPNPYTISASLYVLLYKDGELVYKSQYTTTPLHSCQRRYFLF